MTVKELKELLDDPNISDDTIVVLPIDPEGNGYHTWSGDFERIHHIEEPDDEEQYKGEQEEYDTYENMLDELGRYVQGVNTKGGFLVLWP